MSSRFKQTITSLTAAVIVATLFIGVKSVVADPGVDPPGGDISPTFDSVNVTGDINLEGELKNDATDAGGGLPVTIGDDLILNGRFDSDNPLIYIDKTIELAGSIFVRGGNVWADRIYNLSNGPLHVSNINGLRIDGPLSGGTPGFDNFTLTIEDDAIVENDLEVQGAYSGPTDFVMSIYSDSDSVADVYFSTSYCPVSHPRAIACSLRFVLGGERTASSNVGPIETGGGLPDMCSATWRQTVAGTVSYELTSSCVKN